MAPKEQRKRVLIVGAGAAGMSCAQHLSQHPERFEVSLIDAVDYCGGQAFSIPIDKGKHKAGWLNQGVQGGSYIFHHTMTMFARHGFHADPVKLQLSFGKDDSFWTNIFPTKLLEKHQSEIKRFSTMLKIVRWCEPFFALLPIKYLMKLFWFSDDFTNRVALPMVALFLGTGNATPWVPSIILERLCTSPTYGMWYPADRLSVVSNLPPMVVFPNLSEFYETWRKSLVKEGVDVRLSTELTAVEKRNSDGVLVTMKQRTRVLDGHNPTNGDPEGLEWDEEYDELVLCVLADTAKQLLAKTATFRERHVLGSAKFSDDVTITHSDSAYMRKHYDSFYREDQAVSQLSGKDQTGRLEMARKDFKPMYYIKEYPEDESKLEMCFDCTNYQAQFPESVKFDDHVFQTIFLNKERDSKLWSIDEIEESKIIRKDWWHQLCHSFTHYLFVIPWLMFLQGKKHTRFAAAWTLVNAHEVAVISGIAAAVDLGARYPEDLERDKFALLSFRLYYLLVYGKWYKKRGSKQGDGSNWASGHYGSVYGGPGVAKEERTMHREEVQ
ncbi:MAG: hypothetical protein M1818_008418 [Claussenomyces sp. TS43310]|nr:MAG: hypothetical protein M1818_008418 [Claussenomyces sp. TS43310]